MKDPTLVRRYARGLVAALADEAEFRRVAGEIEAFSALVRSRDDLRRAVTNPFLSLGRRTAIVREVLEGSGAHEKTVRLVLLLAEHGRLAILDDIAAQAPREWNERHGVSTLEVSSVVPLTDVQKARLTASLEHLEGRPVSLAFRIDPGLIGGLSLRKGNVVYDASVAGDLSRLKERITEGP